MMSISRSVRRVVQGPICPSIHESLSSWYSRSLKVIVREETGVTQTFCSPWARNGGEDKEIGYSRLLLLGLGRVKAALLPRTTTTTTTSTNHSTSSLNLNQVAILRKNGHRLRLTISSSHFNKDRLNNTHLTIYRQLSTTTTLNMAQQSTPNGSICRQNYHEECEAHVNKQINMELYASYVYMSMAYYFDRADVALPGFHKYFKKASDEEREHAEKFMKYQNMRGGRIVLQPIAKPTRDEWSGPLEAVTAALELEKTVNQTLLDLHVVSGRNGDPQLCDFLETEFLEEQVKAIKELSCHVTNLNRVGKGLGEFTYDKELCEEEGS